MKALVTGAGGFLGLYIVEQLLARGHRVKAFCRGTYHELDALGVETIRGDLRDREATIAACEGVDIVFHAAAVAGIAINWKLFHGINTLGTRHVVEGCRRHRVGRLVFTSSPSVTFDGTDQQGVDESVPYPEKWLCHYPQTKAAAEQHVLENDEDGLATCALRPHLIWGPRDRHLIPRLLQRARSARLRRVGDGKNLVDTIYVENAAEAHLMAADALAEHDSPVAGRAYFLSQGEPVNCWDWINEILALAGLPPVEKSISLSAAWKVGAAMETVYKLLRLKSEPPMTRFLAAQLATSHYFDITRAREDFGYEPTISAEEGMRRLGVELAPNGFRGVVW